STDFDGSELYDLWVRDIESGEIVDGPVPGTYYGFAWSKDAGSFFYTRPDEAMRPFQVWLHRVGSPNDSDRLVYEEKDPKFYLSVGMTKDEELIVIESDSRTTSETRVISSFAPEEEPKVVLARRSGIEHSVEHVAGRLLILTNDCAEDFRLVLAPIDDPAPDNWEDVVPHRPGTRLDGFDIFENHIALFERSEACATTKIMPRRIESDPATRPAWDFAATVTVPQPEEVSTTWDSANPEIATSVLRYGYTSMVTPSCIFDYDMETGERTLLKSQPVLGGYEPKNYVTERLWAVSADGARIPISLVRRSDLAQQSPHPTLLYGYGSYEASMDPTFSSVRLSLLDRGFVYAIAHVRGGGEMGRKWYEQGKMLAKRNSFEDFVACARHLIDTGISTPSTLVARGGSAGGLLMGAVANLAPELFAAIVAEVPFVDCLTTILDETLPLTVNEWEEWGNPVEDRDTYMYMKSYSPYDNVRDGVQYPAILATAGLNDPRVSYWEPAKWVARLREANPSNRIMLKTEMGAGHQGPSGRYDAWKDEAFVLAFILDAVGLSGT
ncbi:MAG TPA: S9 family peptidase, partial [Acidimicrobiales bacterium]|nr:S9 family peptidase [Acidimicrobiales bacterium]